MNYNIDYEELESTTMRLRNILNQADSLNEECLDAFLSVVTRMDFPGEYGEKYKQNVADAINKMRNNLDNRNNFEILSMYAEAPRKMANIMYETDMNACNMVDRCR